MAIADSFKWFCTWGNAAGKQALDLVDQTCIEHLPDPFINAPVKFFTWRMKPHKVDIKSRERLTRPLAKVLGKRLSGLQPDFESPDDLRSVMFGYPRRCRRIKTRQDAMQMGASLAFRNHLQPVPPVHGSGGPIEQSFIKRSQI